MSQSLGERSKSVLESVRTMEYVLMESASAGKGILELIVSTKQRILLIFYTIS